MRALYAMPLRAFIDAHKGAFVKVNGRGNIVGVLSCDGATLWRLEPGEQRRGTLCRPAVEILNRIWCEYVAPAVSPFSTEYDGAGHVETVTLADGPAEQCLAPGVAPVPNATRQIAAELARRAQRQGHADPGPLFDETAKAQIDLF